MNNINWELMRPQDIEIWKDIKGYEGSYQVSNKGRVRCLDRIDSLGHHRNGFIMKQKCNEQTKGRCIIALCKNGKYKHCSVHRLVAEAFIPNINNLPQVNHKDENPRNNNVWNLEWCTPEYNNSYGTRLERVAKNNSLAQKGKEKPDRRKKVGIYDANGDLIRVYGGVTIAAKELNIRQSSISNAIRKNSRCKGYNIRFV